MAKQKYDKIKAGGKESGVGLWVMALNMTEIIIREPYFMLMILPQRWPQFRGHGIEPRPLISGHNTLVHYFRKIHHL